MTQKTARTSVFSKGFTLIELLVVIAVLGVLATVLMVAIDPAEQFARGRDAGKKTTVAQLGHALQAYYTSHANAAGTAGYPTANTSWLTSLTNTGDLKALPATAGGTTCTGGTSANFAQVGYCYNTGTSGTTVEAMVYARLEAKQDNGKCPAATPTAYFLYSANFGGGVVCAATAVEPAIQYTLAAYAFK